MSSNRTTRATKPTLLCAALLLLGLGLLTGTQAQTRTVTTDDEGFYTAVSMPAGTYAVSAAPSGFKKTVSSGVQLHVSERLVVNLDLQVGDVTETVTVTGTAQLV